MSKIAKLFNLAAPIIQAPMAGSQGYALAAAVCNAGGLGSIPAAMHTPESLNAEIKALRKLTNKPFNINFFAHQSPTAEQSNPTALNSWHQALAPYYCELGLNPDAIPTGAGRTPFSADFLDVLEIHKPAIVSFHFGLPDQKLLECVRNTGAHVWSTATTLEEAHWLQQQGVDAVIAQGLEAGGHRGMFLDTDLESQIPLQSLLTQLIHNIEIPIIGAGGLATAADITRAKSSGVDAVQIGTAYLCTPEATTSALHRAALLSGTAHKTALTNLFSGRPARGIINRLMRELGPISAHAPTFPLATHGITPLRNTAEKLGSSDFSPLWSGQNAKSIKSLPASVITAQFIHAWLNILPTH